MIDEYVEFSPVEHVHVYEDVPEFEILAYSLEEIFAEKLRALYQRERARDHYDLYRMITEIGVDDAVVLPAFQAKCEHDGLEIDLSDRLPAEKRGGIRDGWNSTLPTLVADIPDLDEVYETIESYLESLVGVE
jgi:predicted nucleotidyltransferase component of viral defense system